VTKLSFFTLALLGGVGCAVVACSSDGDDTAAAGGSGGSAGKGTAGSSSAGKGGSSTAGTSATTEAGAGGETSIYEDLGETKGITDAVDAIVAAEVQDMDIASYFSQSTSNPNYSPSVADIKACLVIQLAAVSGGPYTYPAKTAAGYQCRDMVTTHADLGINSGTFDKFVSIAATVLTTAGVPMKDLVVIGGVLDNTKPAIVTDTTTTAEKPCTAPAACAAAGDGAGGNAN
jgi:hypothetical protein